jgi:acetyltransferase-like isoleucine patch superfamily enzyme
LSVIAEGAFVDPEAVLADDVVVAAGAVVHAGAEMGRGCTVGSGAVINSGVVVGANALIEEGAVLGKRPRLRPGSSAAGSVLGALEVGDGVTVCVGAVLYASARVRDGAIIGDQACVRERSVVGVRTVIGRASTIDFDCVVGDRVSIQTGVYVTAFSVVEDDVFLGPGVTTTNDDTMGRHLRGSALTGPVFRRACRVGGCAVLVPGVVIGEEAYVAAGAVVTRDVEARTVVMGVPARVVRPVPESDLLEHWA